MTKGPWALYFGGEDILPELSDEGNGRHMVALFVVSILFSISIAGTNHLQNIECSSIPVSVVRHV